MKLNKEAKKEARKMIEEAVKDIPEGQRLHFDKELLEQLLFETKELKKENGEFGTAKFVVWITPYLSKIDLSEVSFDNVCWHPELGEELYDEFVENYINTECPKFKDDNIESKRNTTFGWEPKIDLSNTNAKIDFSKAFSTSIYSFNFENTDLSNNILTEKNHIIDICNYANTGLRIQTTKIPEDILLKFEKYHELYTQPRAWKNKEYNKLGEELKQWFSVKERNEYIQESLERGFLDGCYLDGKYILSKGKIQLTPEEKEEYDKMRNGLLSSISQSIEEQTGKKSRK